MVCILQAHHSICRFDILKQVVLLVCVCMCVCVGVGVLLAGAGLDDVALVCCVANVNADGAAEDGAEGEAPPPSLPSRSDASKTSLLQLRTSI